MFSIKKVATFVLVGSLAIVGRTAVIQAHELPIAGMTVVLDKFYDSAINTQELAIDNLIEEISVENNQVFTQVSNNVNNRNITGTTLSLATRGDNSNGTMKLTTNNLVYSRSNNSSLIFTSSNNSSDDTLSGSDIADYAVQFEGNPYVWGGTSLRNGTDCSGFTQSVYKKFGISIPRTSRTQASAGRRVSIDNVKPGDLIFYAKGGTINHVAIYIGDDKVISASSPSVGIRISAYNYRKPVKAVRYN